MTSFGQAKAGNSPVKAKLIALYFPQFHAVAENSAWWGAGFTDWDHVRSAIPQYEGHYQPRRPMGDNYYDQSILATLQWQIDTAKRYGLFGFCHYHYWFDGKQLLQTPTELMLQNQSLDFPFCLSWANETWSRRWDGNDHQILIQQTHPPTHESWKKHYDYLIRAWTDPRAIKVDDKPVFVIYRPQYINRIDEMLAYWRQLARADGLSGLYFVFQKQHDLAITRKMKSFDAVFQFQPFEAVYSPTFKTRSLGQSLVGGLLRNLPERFQDRLRGMKSRVAQHATFYDYEAVWQQIVRVRPDSKLTTFPGAFVDWDNAPRYKHRATVFRGASPAIFADWFRRLVASMPERQLPENFIFMNAWNEWSEGAYLEPDQRHGYQYLEAVRKALEE